MGQIFFEITLVICLAAVLTVACRLLKQPAILAYILTGIIIGPLGQLQLHSQEVLQAMGELGITLLLFMIGLELKLSELKSVGKVAATLGIAQIIFTTLLGFAICQVLGFSTISSLYISVALMFSSTIFVVKLLSDKKDLSSLYGKISLGFLLIQDFVAILSLVFLSGFKTASYEFSIFTFVVVIVKALILFGIIVYISKALLPKLIDSIASSSETLFLFSIAWALGLSALVSSSYIGFSIEIGGFLAGLSLANASENFQIAAKIKALRDFFITMFFVILGTSITFTHFGTIWAPAVVLSLFVLIGNPLIVMIILGLQGYRKRTSFLAGLTAGQVSEFSFILVFLGNSLGHIPQEVVSLVTLVGIVTFTLSTYMILHGNSLHRLLGNMLTIFERKNIIQEEISSPLFGQPNFTNHVVLVGANRMGESILEALLDSEEKVLVVDFDPDIIKKLAQKNVPYLFGDISDLEIQERARLDKAKLIISTIPDTSDNLILLKELRKNKKAKVVVIGASSQDAKELYASGADYVVVPHLLGGKHLAKMIKDDTLEKMNGSSLRRRV